MGLLDKLLNPVWRRIEQLDDARKVSVSFIIVANGFWRSALEDELVKPFERLCNGAATAALRRDGQKIVPLAQQIRERLIDEALLACLSACRRSSLPQGTIHSFDPSVLPDAIGCIALAEINSRLKRTKPDVLEGTGYSLDTDEARTQLLLAWMKILQLSDANFVGVVAASFFQEKWATCTDALLAGSLKAIGRNDPDVLYNRARQDLSAFSPRAKAVVDHLARRAGGERTDP